MICYKDTTFCSRPCGNKRCERNQININVPPELEWMPIAYRDYSDCSKYVRPKLEGKSADIVILDELEGGDTE